MPHACGDDKYLTTSTKHAKMIANQSNRIKMIDKRRVYIKRANRIEYLIKQLKEKIEKSIDNEPEYFISNLTRYSNQIDRFYKMLDFYRMYIYRFNKEYPYNMYFKEKMYMELLVTRAKLMHRNFFKEFDLH